MPKDRVMTFHHSPLVTFPLPTCFADASFSGTPPTYGYDADRAEEQRRHHDILPYIDDSPSSSPHLSSKSRSSRDTLSSGSLESSKSVSAPPVPSPPGHPRNKGAVFQFLIAKKE